MSIASCQTCLLFYLLDDPVRADVCRHGELVDPDGFALYEGAAAGGVLLLLVQLRGEGEKRVVVGRVLCTHHRSVLDIVLNPAFTQTVLPTW